MDSLNIMDKFYEKKYQDMETRLYRLYDEIEGVENSIEEVKNRLLNIRQQKISEENVYQFLLYFDKLYDKFTDLEKKEFLNSFVEQVDIYEQEQPDGRFLKHIKFRFPVCFGDRETQELYWDNESTVETVVEQVDIYEQEQPDGRFLKHIKFRFPVCFGDRETQELYWDNESTVETVCCLQKREII